LKAEPRFPPGLLKQSWKERLRFFIERKILHKKMMSVGADIQGAIHRRADEGIIFVMGPTRVGKTTVFKHLVNSLLKDYMQEMIADPGCIPVAGMEMPSYPRGYIWKDHWVGCLEALNEPMIEHKTASRIPDVSDDRVFREKVRESKTETILRRAFENAAKKRKLRVFCIDEAHHLTLVPYAKMYRAQLEVIKSVASRSHAVQVLFGTYDLLKLRNANGQLGARAKTIHFSRYRPDTKDDLKSFADVATSLASYMPLAELPSLEKDMDYCFEMCLGCVGLLKIWMIDALGDALENGQRTLSRKDLERHEPPLDVLEKISDEIVKGEAALEQKEWLREKIRRRMLQATGAAYLPTPLEAGEEYRDDPPNNPADVEEEGTLATTGGKARRKRTRKGGKIERAPKRDKVGGGRKKDAA
jgi:AAA domain